MIIRAHFHLQRAWESYPKCVKLKELIVISMYGLWRRVVT